MELPQPSGIYATEGRKMSHDFLSLNSHSPVQRDARSSHEFLQTQDFLQPLEMEDKNSRKRNNIVKTDIEGTPPPILPSSEAHLLHGGVGTFSISHISSLNPTTPKPEGSYFTLSPGVSNNDRNEENSNCKSYTTGSSFTLWEEPSTWKGKTEPTFNSGEWPVDRPSASSSSPRNSFSTQSVSRPHVQENQSLTKILNSANGLRAKEEAEDGDFTFGGESTSRREDLHFKFNGKGSNDQIPNATRSKHSATEQRRRCKINERLQMLREIIPRSDQKRDKATFLTEVIEYIQLLQEKVSRYEGSCPGWSSEPTKLMPWRNSPNLAESLLDQPQGLNRTLQMFTTDSKSIVIAPTAARKQQNQADSNSNIPTTATSIPTLAQTDVSSPFPSTRNSSEATLPVSRVAVSDTTSLPHAQLSQSRGCSMGNNELAMEGGAINISGIYSQGLLNTLTQALRSSGVDLSQASISVQVDVGKRANHGQNAHRPTDTDFDTSCDGSTLLHERAETNRLRDSSQATKRLKMVKS